MFYAHSGAAMAASPSDRAAPIWIFLLASWSPDLTGVGHWWPFAFVLSAVFLFVGRRRWSTRAGIALALLVWSHLLLDLVVGLQIWPSGRFLGLNLSTHDGREFALELLAVAIGCLAFALGRRAVEPYRALAFTFMLGFAVAVWSFPVDPGDQGPSLAKLGVGVTGLLVTSALLIVSDRRVRTRF